MEVNATLNIDCIVPCVLTTTLKPAAKS